MASTTTKYNTRSPTIRRILREAQEIATAPSPDFTAHPLEQDLFEWHFTLRGPPEPSPYAGGFYHGRIILAPTYPHRPPMFRFLTPSARFEVNRDICLSMSGHHEETWQPAWGIRTALVALRAFMDTNADGQVGGMESGEAERKALAKESVNWRCPDCGGGGEEQPLKDAAAEAEASGKKTEEEVPAELKLGYKDEMKTKKAEDEVQAPTQGSTSFSTASDTEPLVTTEAPPAQAQTIPPAAEQQSTTSQADVSLNPQAAPATYILPSPPRLEEQMQQGLATQQVLAARQQALETRLEQAQQALAAAQQSVYNLPLPPPQYMPYPAFFPQQGPLPLQLPTDMTTFYPYQTPFPFDNQGLMPPMPPGFGAPMPAQQATPQQAQHFQAGPAPVHTFLHPQQDRGTAWIDIAIGMVLGLVSIIVLNRV